jgi:hypothetical protein
MKLGFVVALSLCVSCVRGPSEPSASPQRVVDLPIPPELHAKISRAELIGRQLYVLDKVSAIATDVLAAYSPNFRDEGLGGYLPLLEMDEQGRSTESFTVSFFTREDPPRVAYEVRMKPDMRPELEAFDPPKVATEWFVALVRARQMALSTLPPVHQPMNPVLVLASENGEEGVLVYLIAGTTTPNVVVFGQHFRVLVSDDESTPTYVMPMSKAPLEVPIHGGPKGAKSSALAVTHLVTDWPLETHVLASLQARLPVYVGTKSAFWRVDGDKIALISDRPPNAQ